MTDVVDQFPFIVPIDWLSYFSWPLLVLQTFLAALMVLLGDIFALIDFFSFTAWMFYGSTMAALLVLRYTMKDVERPYKVGNKSSFIMHALRYA